MLGISEEIRKAIEELGFEHPTPVQEEVIPYLLGEGNDVIALAQTGTGKTAAYGLPLIQKVNPQQKHTQALILSPTRELCLQISDSLSDFSKYIKGLTVVPVYGGTSIETQIKHLKRYSNYCSNTRTTHRFDSSWGGKARKCNQCCIR